MHLGQRTTLARVQAICSEFLGNMIAYEDVAGGRLFQDIVPSRRDGRMRTDIGSDSESSMHTEGSIGPMRPDYLSLACLRGGQGSVIRVTTARDIVHGCDDDQVTMLREPMWRRALEATFCCDGPGDRLGDALGPMPIIAGSADDPFVLMDQDLMRGINEPADRLLDQVRRICLASRHSYDMAEGDLLILDNNRAVHSCSAGPARLDGTDSFVVGSFAVRDLAKSRYARDGDSRVVASRFG
jgi:L-asparagine oxygenase